MEPTPTGESATPTADDEPDRVVAENTPADAPGRADVEDHADAPSTLPTPRAAYALPRRSRTATGAPRKAAGRDPEGRVYRAPDEETLDRLLAGLRDI